MTCKTATFFHDHKRSGCRNRRSAVKDSIRCNYATDVGPNITGGVKEVPVLNIGVVTEGALLVGEATRYSIQGNDSKASGLNFDASKSNSIYGQTSVVQPSALMVLPCIKI